jgi:hypothetical protein
MRHNQGVCSPLMFVFACASALVPVGVTAAIASWPMRPEAAVSAPSDPPASAPGGKKKVTNAAVVTVLAPRRAAAHHATVARVPTRR